LALPIAAIVMVLLRYAYERYSQSEMYQEPATPSPIVLGRGDEPAGVAGDPVIVVESATPAPDDDRSA
jgi:hypothetical protein